MLDSVAYLNWTPIFDWYVLWCGFKNVHHKYMCLNESKLCISNMLTIPGSTINMVGVGGHIHDHLMSTRIFTLRYLDLM